MLAQRDIAYNPDLMRLKSSAGRVCLAILYMSLTWSSARAQEEIDNDNLSFDQYSVIQYAATRGLAPQNVLKMDTNGALVLAAATGITREELLGRMEVSESQVALLKTFRLIEERDDTLWTTFPILGPEATRRMRTRIRRVAPYLESLVAEDVHSFLDALDGIGRRKNAYSMLFSYVLDGLVWREFERKGSMVEREITGTTPLWAGEIWALYPPRDFVTGTNSISEDGVAFKVNWTHEAIPHMIPFVADFATLSRMFDDYRSEGTVQDDHVREVFGPYGLFDESGVFTIPVVVEEPGNLFYQLGRDIAASIADAAPAALELDKLVREFGFRGEQQALIVAYHELMWDILAAFESDGVVQRPVAFSNPEATTPADIADLIFIVRDGR